MLLQNPNSYLVNRDLGHGIFGLYHLGKKSAIACALQIYAPPSLEVWRVPKKIIYPDTMEHLPIVQYSI